MTAFVVRSLLARRRRAAMTALAVLIGVAMISGTFVFTDTINAAFRHLFTDASVGADVIVSSRQNIASNESSPASMPVSLISAIRAKRGVAAVAGQVSDVATIVGRDGHVIKSPGAPTLALSYVPPPFTGITFVAGTRPHNSQQVAIDQATADRQGFRVGDRVSIVTAQPVRRFQISGIARLGGASLGGGTFAVFDLGTARGLYDKEGQADVIYVRGARSVAASTLIKEIRPLLSPELVVRTKRAQVDNDVSRIADRLHIVTTGLLAFGFIAVLVGAFVIFNTFSITVSQRLREFALIRAIGATRAQVLLAVLVEAAAIGAVASVGGLAGGLLAATGIRALFNAVGFDLPSTSLQIEPRTIIVGVAVGLLVTMIAGLGPAIRATRVAPLEALQESTVPASRARSLLRAIPAAVLAGVGLIAILTNSGATSKRLEETAIGSLAVVLAIVVVSPLAIRRLATIIAWPIERRGRIVGRLARENAARNPTRTAVSASALMIGLALVLFVTVYANGLRTSTTRIIRQSFLGDFAIENEDGSSSIPAASARATAAVPGVLAVSSLKTADAHLPGDSSITAEAIEPTTIGQVYRFDWISGSDSTLASLGPGDAVVERDTARSAHLKVGDRTTLISETGTRTPITVMGIYKDQALLRGVAMPREQFDQIFHQARLQEVFVKLDPLADRATADAALNQALSSFPGVVARSEKQLEGEVAGHVNSILALFYALLAMSVLMSLLGLLNTLNLSIYERTRELGLLRAVGMSARQGRQLIRDESVITAAIGTVVGVAVGIFVAWVITRALADEGITFSLPWPQVIAVVAVGLLAGVVAAIPPAARVSRLDLLDAIAHE